MSAWFDTLAPMRTREYVGRRVAISVMLLAAAATALTGCRGSSPSAVPIASYGPCSSQQECYDDSYAAAQELDAEYGRAMAADCVGANTSVAAKASDRIASLESDFTVEASAGDCRAVLRFADNSMQVDFYRN